MRRKWIWDGKGEARGHSALPVLFLISGLFIPHGSAWTQQEEPFRIAVKVDLVVLQATVRDRKGHAVAGLEKDNFSVYEDGELQSIHLFQHEDTPVSIGLLVDHSGSMQEKLDDVTAAARAFVTASNPDDQMFVVNFNESVRLGLPAAKPFSSSAAELGAAIGNAPAMGLTALYDALLNGLRMLEKGKLERKVLVVISDGGDNASRATLDQVLRAAEQSNAAIYTIGIFDPDDPDRNPKVLRRLARETGGEAFFPSALPETVEICRRIAREVRNQYVLGYIAGELSSRNARPGTYHAIRVTAHSKQHGKLSVRTRAGYRIGDLAK